MGKKIYVGNLSYNTYEDGLRALFQNYGTVASAKIITDRDSGQSKGFGFVEMGTEEEARAAISALNGQDLDGRALKVNEAMDKPRRDDNRWYGNIQLGHYFHTADQSRFQLFGRRFNIMKDAVNPVAHL